MEIIAQDITDLREGRLDVTVEGFGHYDEEVRLRGEKGGGGIEHKVEKKSQQKSKYKIKNKK